MHIPVLLPEVLEYLNPQPGQTFVDCTLGLGGHSKAILEKVGPNGSLLAFEHDPRNRKIAEKNLEKHAPQMQIFPKNFSHFSSCLSQAHISSVDGVLFDLGISSAHLDDAERGFSFRYNGPLDMRMDPQGNQTRAADILRNASVDELIRIFREYGEEKRAARFAHDIVRERTHIPFETTHQLAKFIADRSPHGKHPGGHPATLVFQALRIAVNNELGVLESALEQIIPFLSTGARIGIISFHSLEDRIVKTFFRRYSTRRKNQKYPSAQSSTSEREMPLCTITRKPITPGAQEIAENPRARSARMRVAEKI